MFKKPHGRTLAAVGASMFWFLTAGAMGAWAQVTPAEGYTPPDDTPTIKLSGVIFADYTYVMDPETMVEGNNVNANSFNIGRTYLNLTGNISHRISFRLTPDIARETGSGSSLNGSYTFRLKYAFGQFNLDEWATKGSWIRFGLQQTPYVDFNEGVYRYRFQGPIFVDREGKLTSSDAAVSAHFNFASNYGDAHFGIYNGDGYNHFEANDQKAFQGRVTFRPLPHSDQLKGLRVTFFLDGDNYASSDAKKRYVSFVSYEHPRINAGFDYLSAKDQTTNIAPEVKSNGFSVWATPKFTHGWEALLRFDSLKPNKDQDARKKTTILGVAYWFPVQKGVNAVVMFDYQQVKFDDPLPNPDQKQIAVHTQFAF